MNKEGLFIISVVSGLLLTTCHCIEKKVAATEFSKREIASVNSFSVVLSFTFRTIPAGKFIMGSPPSDWKRDSDEAQKSVEITKPFEIMTTEVTQKQWFQVMKSNPSYFKQEGHCSNHEAVNEIKICPNHPVESVSWNEVQEFIKRLNDSLDLKGCKGSPHDSSHCYRLPTEAEWEWAVRARTETVYFFGEKLSALGNYAWYSGNSEGGTHEVGKKDPNPWGLYDVYGVGAG